MTTQLLFFILITHWVADFVLQTDDMAKGKSKSNKWLSLHALTYTIVFVLVAGYIFLCGDQCEIFKPMSLGAVYTWITINGALHWITDYFTSRASSILWQKGRVHDFFVCVGFDQLIHYTCWIGTFLLLK